MKRDTEANEEPQKQVTLFKNQVILNPTISLINYISFNLYYLVIIFAYVSVDVLQPVLLSSKDYYNVTDLTTVNSTITVWDMLVKISLAPLYGFMCDRVGRRIVVFIGIISMSAGILLLPFIGGGVVFPYYVFARALYANGAIACIVVPLLADYVDYETKGRASSILVVLSGLGAVFSSSFCTSMTANISVGQRYIYLAAIVFFAGMLVGFGLKGGKYHKKLYYDAKAEQARQELVGTSTHDSSHILQQNLLENDEQEDPKKKGFLYNLKTGIQQAQNPWIALGYIVSFLSRGDTGILTYALVIWSKHFYASDDDSQKKGETQAYILSGVAYTVLLCTALFFGFVGDRYSKFKSLMVIYVCTVIGLILLIFCKGPTDVMAFVSMAFIGIGVAGYSTFSLQLVNKYANTKFRGSVNAMSSLLGVIGLVAISIGGGYLQGVDINAAFYMFMGFSALALIATSCLYIKSKVLQKL